MQLFGSYTSPFVRHCRIALLETGLPCDFVETDYAASAVGSPAQRVPYLEDDHIQLHDSAAILKYLRSKAGQPFLDDAVDYDRFCLVNTALDTTVNVFLLERDGITPQQSAYLQRQSNRIASSLEALNGASLPAQAPYSDADLRLACFLDWALFRNRFTLDAYPQLAAFLENANSYEHFRVTAPPR